ncbi:MAG TPA: hypothetical protein VJS85_01610 [Rhizomicrobium sp.]|nr:hypothetical protein [Rhizomicrobium sp.]
MRVRSIAPRSYRCLRSCFCMVRDCDNETGAGATFMLWSFGDQANQNGICDRLFARCAYLAHARRGERQDGLALRSRCSVESQDSDQAKQEDKKDESLHPSRSQRIAIS